MIGDFRQAFRALVRRPGYVAAFVATLGLGIGANTAIFSVVNGVLLQPLPYPDADRIMYLRQPAVMAGVANVTFSFAEVADYTEATRTLDELVGFGDWTFNVVGQGEPHRAVAGLVTSNYFSVLGLAPQLGRTLQGQDDLDGAEPVVVLTHEYWSRVFGEDPGVIGARLELSAKPATVVGVLEPGSHYTGTRRQEFYANYATNDHYMGASMQDERTHRMTDVFARLAPGATVEGAQAEMSQINARLHEAYPEAYPERLGYAISVAPWKDELTANARPMLLTLLGTVVLILIIAAANVANLTLTRLIRAERELAIRAALGAGTARLRRQILTETIILSLLGGGLGLVLAVIGLDALTAYTNRFTVRTGEIGVDFAVLGFTLMVGVGVAVAVAWFPALPIKKDLGTSLTGSGGGRSTGSRGRRRTQRALVVSQLAMSFAVLVGAGLLVRSLIRLNQVDPGFEVERVLTMDAPNMTGMSQDENELFWRAVQEELTATPGVVEVAVASRPPLRNAQLASWQFRLDGREDEDATLPPTQAAFNDVSPSYFDAVGTPILEGRGITALDDQDSEPVVVVNESFARAFFRDQSPVGHQVQRSFDGQNWSRWATVVGVAADTREYGLAMENVLTVYRAQAQSAWGPTLILKTIGEPTAVAGLARNILQDNDPDRPVDQVMTLDQLRAEDMAPTRLNAALFTGFAILALVIAAVGVLGVLAFSVSQRTNEFGIRMALGAEQSQVLSMVLKEGLAMTGIALVLGGVGALLLSNLLAGLLYEIQPTDPVTFLSVAGILSVVALIAALAPARRATAVDPMTALRRE